MKLKGQSNSCRHTESGEGRTSSFGPRGYGKTEGLTVVAVWRTPQDIDKCKNRWRLPYGTQVQSKGEVVDDEVEVNRARVDRLSVVKDDIEFWSKGMEKLND